MGSNPIFKTVDEFSQNQFKAYKTWTMTESNITGYGSSVNEAVYATSSLIADPFGANASGISKRSLFASVYNMYYKYPNLPYNALGGNSQFQDRDISHRAVVVEIDNDYIGEGIKPGSISITDNSNGSILIRDDGFGNLINITDTTTYVPSSSLVSHWSFNEGFITSGNLATYYENRNHVNGAPTAHSFYTTYTDGIFGSKINFTGDTGSCVIVDDFRPFNFRTGEDFAVSLWVWLPASQSGTPVPDNSILEKWDNYGGYPFVIRTLNQTYASKGGTVNDTGRIYCATWDSEKSLVLTSTAQLTGSIPHHIVYQRQGTRYDLYVDGVLNETGSATGNLLMGQTHNTSKLYVGARGWEGAVSGTCYNFQGSVDELRIYNRSLTAAEISTLYSKPANTNIIGNAFYGHGILTLTDLSGSYSNLMLAGSSFVMNFKSTVTITENNILATVNPAEFNMTLNPSSGDIDDITDQLTYMTIVTGSEWSPYITALGMYDDDLNLLAVAKFAKPIKKPTDMPMTFAIRWDS